MNRIWIPSVILGCIVVIVSLERVYAQDRGPGGVDGIENASLEIEATKERFVVVVGEITRVENENGLENPPSAQRIDTVLLDTWTGKTWRLNYSKSSSYKWEEIPGKRPEAMR